MRPHSQLQAEAQEALRELKAQGLGPTAIATKLNERGIATATGARWHRTTVDLTLRKLRDLDERIAAWETRRARLRTERVPREPEHREEATRLTWRQAAAVMNAEGVRTPTGALYTRDTIRRLLEMPRPDSSAR